MTNPHIAPQFTRRSALLALAGSAVQLAGCGGGGGFAGLSSGGTGSFTSGTITGLGSIIVNGIRYDDSAATVKTREGTGSSNGALRVGMVVSVQGSTVTPATTVGGTATATANRITYGSEWTGPVDGNPVGNTFKVLGQTVDVLATTIFEGVATQLSAIAIGQYVEVYGYVDTATGNLQATRVESTLTQPTQFEWSGIVESLSSASFVMGNPDRTINFTASTPGGGNLSVGRFIHLTLPNTVTGIGPWSAIRIDDQYQPIGDLGVSDDHEAEIHGIVTSKTSATNFSVNGIPVDARLASVPSSLAVGDDVEIHGTVLNGIILASRVEVEDRTSLEAQEFEFHGSLSGLVQSSATAGTFTLKGYTFHYNTAGTLPLRTAVESPDFRTQTNPYIEVKAILNNGQWFATEIDVED
jgi:Domain of unknown function (DUF5666)